MYYSDFEEIYNEDFSEFDLFDECEFEGECDFSYDSDFEDEYVEDTPFLPEYVKDIVNLKYMKDLNDLFNTEESSDHDHADIEDSSDERFLTRVDQMRADGFPELLVQNLIKLREYVYDNDSYEESPDSYSYYDSFSG